jgi:putative heme iron utilization protein
MSPVRDPIRPADAEARALARELLARARHGALAVLDPADGAPVVTRIALALGPDGVPVTLVSDLSAHTAALRADPRASVLVGEPPARGDPLAHPRLTLAVRADFVPRESPAHAPVRAHYLKARPKARLYADFADFGFVRLVPQGAFLNAGFGRAFRLTPADLGLADPAPLGAAD